MPYATWHGGLAEMPVVVPPVAVVREFSDLVGPLLCRVRDGLFENEKLVALRDTLLPARIYSIVCTPRATWEFKTTKFGCEPRPLLQRATHHGVRDTSFK